MKTKCDENDRSPFAHLNNLSNNSPDEAISLPEEIVKAASHVKMSAVALADSGNLLGALTFFDAAISLGVKPIIGLGAILGDQGHRVFSRDNRRFRLTLLAVNDKGLESLSFLLEISWREGYYYRPRIDKELLECFGDGLIVMSGSMAGEIPWLLESGNRSAASSVAKWYQQRFPGRFYLELQDHGYEIQKQVNPQLISLGQELGIPLVATNASRYISRQDAERLDKLLAELCGAEVTAPHRFRLKTEDFYFKSSCEMGMQFTHVPEATLNTTKIAGGCEIPGRSAVERLTILSQALLEEHRKRHSGGR